jgi:hypothetical protein
MTKSRTPPTCKHSTSVWSSACLAVAALFGPRSCGFSNLCDDHVQGSGSSDFTWQLQTVVGVRMENLPDHKSNRKDVENYSDGSNSGVMRLAYEERNSRGGSNSGGSKSGGGNRSEDGNSNDLNEDRTSDNDRNSIPSLNPNPSLLENSIVQNSIVQNSIVQNAVNDNHQYNNNWSLPGGRNAVSHRNGIANDIICQELVNEDYSLNWRNGIDKSRSAKNNVSELLKKNGIGRTPEEGTWKKCNSISDYNSISDASISKSCGNSNDNACHRSVHLEIGMNTAKVNSGGLNTDKVNTEKVNNGDETKNSENWPFKRFEHYKRGNSLKRRRNASPDASDDLNFEELRSLRSHSAKSAKSNYQDRILNEGTIKLRTPTQRQEPAENGEGLD